MRELTECGKCKGKSLFQADEKYMDAWYRHDAEGSPDDIDPELYYLSTMVCNDCGWQIEILTHKVNITD